MHLERKASWADDVFPAWQRASKAIDPNKDVWEKLPEGVSWHVARVEDHDISGLHVIGSFDWKTIFGTYKLQEVSARAIAIRNDQHNHSGRIIKIAAASLEGMVFEKIVVVAGCETGPFVVIDGNHRAAGLHRAGLLVETEIYLGLHPAITTDFLWYKVAVAE